MNSQELKFAAVALGMTLVIVLFMTPSDREPSGQPAKISATSHQVVPSTRANATGETRAEEDKANKKAIWTLFHSPSNGELMSIVRQRYEQLVDGNQVRIEAANELGRRKAVESLPLLVDVMMQLRPLEGGASFMKSYPVGKAIENMGTAALPVLIDRFKVTTRFVETTLVAALRQLPLRPFRAGARLI